MKEIELYLNGNSYGLLGEDTGVRSECNNRDIDRNIKVGDVVAFYRWERLYVGVVVDRQGKYGVMGQHASGLILDNMTIISSYKKLTKETITLFHGGVWELVEINRQEMTVEEVEKELGKKIKIIGDR